MDVNWRPVFFDDEEKAKKTITPYVLQADMLKVSCMHQCVYYLLACVSTPQNFPFGIEVVTSASCCLLCR